MRAGTPSPDDTQARRRSYPWLLLAALLLLFANGRWIVPAAAWLAPVFLVRFLRGSALGRGMALGWGVITLTMVVSWQGLVPLPGQWFYAFAVGFSSLLFVPFLLDRVLVRRIAPTHPFLATLVLPSAMVGLEYVVAMTSPYGTWGSVAYTQYGNLPLVQLVSVTGLWGVTFLVLWFASVVNWAWEQDFEWRKVRSGVLAYGGVIAAVMIFGGLRLALAPADSGTFRIASVTARPDRSVEPFAADGFRLNDPEPMPDGARQNLARFYDQLFAMSEREARGGAQLVFWSEANCPVRKADEPALIDRGLAFAREHGVYLVMALATATPGERLFENKTVTLDPRGEVAATYLKSIPVPGEPSVPGPGKLAVIDTPFGRIAEAICFDMDFHYLLRQAGKAKADVILAPSSDWREIDPLHTRMATFRAIENGAAVVRQTNQGLSIAVDYEGRVLSEVDFFNSAEHTLVARVPTAGVPTIYGYVGDLLAWLCLGLVGFFVAQLLWERWTARAEAMGAVSVDRPADVVR